MYGHEHPAVQAERRCGPRRPARADRTAAWTLRAAPSRSSRSGRPALDFRGTLQYVHGVSLLDVFVRRQDCVLPRPGRGPRARVQAPRPRRGPDHLPHARRADRLAGDRSRGPVRARRAGRARPRDRALRPLPGPRHGAAARSSARRRRARPARASTRRLGGGRGAARPAAPRRPHDRHAREPGERDARRSRRGSPRSATSGSSSPSSRPAATTTPSSRAPRSRRPAPMAATPGALVHSYLDDGPAVQFSHYGGFAGWAALELYVVEELLGARLAHSYGGLIPIRTTARSSASRSTTCAGATRSARWSTATRSTTPPTTRATSACCAST